MCCSTGVIGDKTFIATSGVKQGGCTSCPLFTFYIDSTVDALHDMGPDGWLKHLHMVLFMDDTAVFATSREKLAQKLRKLKEKTDEIGMTIHPRKSRYINVNCAEKAALKIDEFAISHTDEYVYLGTPISNTPVSQQVKSHLRMKSPHTMKFSSFLNKNKDAPFTVKETVWNSAVLSTFLYSSETWLTMDLKLAEVPYMKTLKELLGVRQSTCNSIVLIETGNPSAKTLIKNKQEKFFSKLISRVDYSGSELHQVISLAIQKRTPMGIIIQEIINNRNSQVETSLDKTKDLIQTSDSTRCKTYREINRDLSKCVIYSNQHPLPEYQRIAVSRLRLSSHRLKIETGRWARLPRENRLCSCGQIQTEQHVLLHCRLTQNLREDYPIVKTFRDIGDLFSFKDINIINHLCEYCYKVLNVFV